MGVRIDRGFVVLASLALALLLPLTASAEPEEDLAQIWKQHTTSPEEHAAVVTACEKFAAAHGGHELVPVAEGISAWHLLHLGELEKAKKLLESHLAKAPAELGKRETAVAGSAAIVARAWLTRLDRDDVVASLKLYYKKEVGFPETLAAVGAHPKISAAEAGPATDRYGKLWSYKLVGLRSLPKFADQRYELGSATLEDSAELERALRRSYAESIRVTVDKVWDDLDPPTVRIVFPSGTAALPAGATDRGIHVAFLGSRLIVVSDQSYWKILERP